MKIHHLFLAATFLTLPLSTPAIAQIAPRTEEGSVSSDGNAKLERQPTVMRMQVELSGKGKGVREALARLKDRREAALVHLAALGTMKESIKVTEPTISAAQNEQQRQMQMMIRQRMAGRQKGKKTEAKQPVVLTATLTAEWPLPADSMEELLVTANDLREKIQQVDLAGIKEVEKLSPEEEELAEELAEVNQYGSSSDGPKPGEPRFMFVARISDDEHAKLLGQAFAKARDKASILAAAAGAKLGALQQLHGQETALAAQYQRYYGRMGYDYQYAETVTESGEDSREAVGTEPGKVTYQVNITAAFGLKP